MKPILFNTEMVRAILEGRKTATRRIIPIPNYGYFMTEPPRVVSRYQPGDILYVRETWAKHWGIYWHKAGPFPVNVDPPEKWRPSIHMPKEAARLFLQVTNVWVERLQDITPAQARQEGCDGRCDCPSSGVDGSLSCAQRDFSIERFESVWDSTIKPVDRDRYGWNANPWVWVIEFERIRKEAALKALKGGEGE